MERDPSVPVLLICASVFLLLLSTPFKSQDPALASVCCPAPPRPRWHLHLPATHSTPCPAPLAISKWSGRAGNNLAQLTGAVALANASGSLLVTLPHALFGNGSADRVWDFRSGACAAEQGGVVFEAGFQPGGFFLTHDKKRRPLASPFFNRSNCNAVGLDHMSLRTRRRVTQTLVAPRVPAMVPQHGNRHRHLVIHIRGGDVFSRRAILGRRRQYGQPPLAMYQRLLLDGGYLSVGWSVTVLHEDEANPVVGALRAWWPLLPAAAGTRVTFVDGSEGLDRAVATLVSAHHLVTAVSTLSLNFGLLGAPGLERVHIPWCRQALLMGFLYDGDAGPGVHRHGRQINRLERSKARLRRQMDDIRIPGGQADAGLPGFCYEFPGFSGKDEWMNTADQLDRMVTYPASRVVAHALPLPLPL